MWEDGDLDQLLLEEDALLADTNGGADADDEVDEAPLFSEQPQQPQPRPSAMEEPDDDPPQQGSLLEFSQQQRARAVQQAQARHNQHHIAFCADGLAARRTFFSVGPGVPGTGAPGFSHRSSPVVRFLRGVR